MLAPILNKVRFLSFEQNVRDFYELSLTYATSRFVLNGTVDFAVFEGLVESRKPYFFIQEFERSEELRNPYGVGHIARLISRATILNALRAKTPYRIAVQVLSPGTFQASLRRRRYRTYGNMTK